MFNFSVELLGVVVEVVVEFSEQVGEGVPGASSYRLVEELEEVLHFMPHAPCVENQSYRRGYQ